MTDSDPPTADDLLGQTAWLRRFAAELVGADAADDVAQETLLRALRWGHEARAWRPWLAQVARSVAWRWRRGEASRRQREEATARAESLPSAADTVTAFAAHRAVVEAVSALEEPYRSTLLLRFWEDLPPREVARRMSVPVETVRTRLKRGCALVRGRLDEAEGSRGAWLVPLLGVPGVRDAVASAMAGAGLALPVPFLGGLVMSKAASFAGLCAVVLAAAGLWLWSREKNDKSEVGAAPPPVVGAPADATGTNRVAARGDAAERAGGEADAARLPASARSGPGSLRVQVRLESGAPASGVGVYARDVAARRLGVELRTAAEGEVVFDSLPSGSYRVDLDRCPGATAEVRAGEVTLLPLSLPPGVRVEGRVVEMTRGRADEKTRDNKTKPPVAGARVYAMATHHHDFEQLLAVTDAEGRFAIDDVDPATVLMARADGWQPSRPSRSNVGGKPGDTRQATIELGGRGYRLRGRILDQDGKPAAQALIVVAVDEDSRKHVEGMQTLRQKDGDGMLDREGFFVRAGADGCFDSREVPWGDTSVIARGAGEQRTQVGGTVVHVPKAGTGVEAVVRLRPGATLTGVVRDDRGTPYAGLPLVLEWQGTRELGSVEHDRGHEMLNGTATTAADGTFCFEGVMPGAYGLEAQLGRESIKLKRGELTESMTEHVEAVVTRRASLTVRVVDAQGQPLTGWAVDAAPRPHNTVRSKHARTDASGQCRFEGLPDLDHIVCVHAPEAADPLGFARFPVVMETWRRRGAELVVTIPKGSGATARLRGRMVDARHMPVRHGIEIALSRPDFAEHLNVEADASGAFVAGPLPPGSYIVRSKSERAANQQFGPFELATGEDKDLGELRLLDAARLVVEIALPDAAAANGLNASLVAADGSQRSLQIDRERRTLTSGSLLAGRWTLRIAGDRVAPHVEAVELAPGESKRLQVTCQAGVAVRLAIDCSADAEQVRRGEGHAFLDLWDAEGRQVLAEHYLRDRLDSRGAFAATLRLLPGVYRAKLRGRTGKAELELRVTESGSEPVGVALR